MKNEKVKYMKSDVASAKRSHISFAVFLPDPMVVLLISDCWTVKFQSKYKINLLEKINYSDYIIKVIDLMLLSEHLC